MLRIATLAMALLTAVCCDPAWCRSAHTCLNDLVINDQGRIYL